MTILALDPGLKLGWATNGTGYHAGQAGVFRVDDWLARYYDGVAYEGHDLLARRLSSTRRWLDLVAHYIVPDMLVVEQQPHMGRSGKGSRGFSAHGQINRSIETVCIELAGDRDILLLRPAPNTWQAWAKRNMPDRLTEWQTRGRPDDVSAQMMLAWALATQKVEREAA
ncbi:MAG: hypothetical protein AB7O44_32360 [Hyphomicrobiaceae bacterium]